MFERFTDRARRVLVLAQEEAASLQHDFLGTEHILLGLIKEGEGVGAKALEGLGFTLEAVRAKILEAIPPAGPSSAEPPPFTPRARKVLELALRQALTLGHNYIGTEHILLGLIHEGEGVAAQVLVAGGARLEDVRTRVIDLLAAYGPATPGRAAAAGAPTVLPKMTPGATQLVTHARTAAAIGKAEHVGTHHFLVGMLATDESVAAKVLSSFGVTAEAVKARIEQLGVFGTTDETDGDRNVELAPGVTVRFASSELVEKYRRGELQVSIYEAPDSSKDPPPPEPPATEST